MALINCSECGKEVSDKASACPNCGNPINQNLQKIIENQPLKQSDDDNLYCPKCHSKNLHTQQKGFSGKKALAGVVLTGGIGILAGTIGSKNIEISCLNCGNKFKASEALKRSDIARIQRINKKNSREDTLVFSADKDISKLIKSGDKTAATELYKERKGVSSEEANKYINQLANAIKGREKRKNEENLTIGCAIFIVIVILAIMFSC